MTKKSKIIGGIFIGLGLSFVFQNTIKNVAIGEFNIQQIYYSIKICSSWLMVIAGILIYSIKEGK